MVELAATVDPEEIQTAVMDGDITMDDVIEAVTDFANDQGWTLEEAVNTLWEAIPEEYLDMAKKAKNDILGMVASGDLTFDTIAEKVEEVLATKTWDLQKALNALKKSCPNLASLAAGYGL